MPVQAKHGQASLAYVGQASPSKSSPGQARPAQSRPGLDRLGRPSPGQETPVQASLGKASPGHSRPGRSRPMQASAGRPGPPQASLGQACMGLAWWGRAGGWAERHRAGRASGPTFPDALCIVPPPSPAATKDCYPAQQSAASKRIQGFQEVSGETRVARLCSLGCDKARVSAKRRLGSQRIARCNVVAPTG